MLKYTIPQIIEQRLIVKCPTLEDANKYIHILKMHFPKNEYMKAHHFEETREDTCIRVTSDGFWVYAEIDYYIDRFTIIELSQVQVMSFKTSKPIK